MSDSMKNRFQMRGRYYSADAIGAVVQLDENTVEVRYLDRTPPVQIPGTTVERVTYAIDRAKRDRR